MLGVSLDEQERIPTYELDMLLAVDDVANEVQQEEAEQQRGNV